VNRPKSWNDHDFFRVRDGTDPGPPRLLLGTNLRTIESIEWRERKPPSIDLHSGRRVVNYLGKMPQRVMFSLILLLAIILTGLRDDTSWLPRVPAPATALVDAAEGGTPTLLAAR
jgi:hypothetical protein